MTRDTIYRTTALIGSILILVNVFYFDSHLQFFLISTLIELVVVPITVITASFWYKKNITLVGVALYFTAYAFKLSQLIFELNFDSIVYEYERPFRIFGAIGIGLVIAASTGTLNKLGKNWFSKSMNKPELRITLLSLIIFLLTIGVIHISG